jgi:hypothetical protein
MNLTGSRETQVKRYSKHDNEYSISTEFSKILDHLSDYRSWHLYSTKFDVYLIVV